MCGSGGVSSCTLKWVNTWRVSRPEAGQRSEKGVAAHTLSLHTHTHIFTVRGNIQTIRKGIATLDISKDAYCVAFRLMI